MSMSSAMSKKFGKMLAGERIFFLGALLAFICTAGFAFPNLLHDEDYVKKYN